MTPGIKGIACRGPLGLFHALAELFEPGKRSGGVLFYDGVVAVVGIDVGAEGFVT